MRRSQSCSTRISATRLLASLRCCSAAAAATARAAVAHAPLRGTPLRRESCCSPGAALLHTQHRAMASAAAAAAEAPPAWLAPAAAALRQADALIFTAGAGMGCDSGLPDFRGPQGFWRAYPPMEKLRLAFEDCSNPKCVPRRAVTCAERIVSCR